MTALIGCAQALDTAGPDVGGDVDGPTTMPAWAIGPPTTDRVRDSIG